MYNKERNDSIVEMFRRGGDAVRVFDLLIERYSERLYWHIRRIVVQHEEAEDILQDTFVAAYTSFDKFRGDNEGSLTAWLYRIATNLSIRALRRRLCDDANAEKRYSRATRRRAKFGASEVLDDKVNGQRILPPRFRRGVPPCIGARNGERQ